MLADDLLPINTLVAVAVVKGLLSSDFFMDGIARLTVALLAWLEAGCQAGRARDGQLHGYVPAVVCSQLNAIRRPFGRIVEVVACGQRGRS